MRAPSQRTSSRAQRADTPTLSHFGHGRLCCTPRTFQRPGMLRRIQGLCRASLPQPRLHANGQSYSVGPRARPIRAESIYVHVMQSFSPSRAQAKKKAETTYSNAAKCRPRLSRKISSNRPGPHLSRQDTRPRARRKASLHRQSPRTRPGCTMTPKQILASSAGVQHRVHLPAVSESEPNVTRLPKRNSDLDNMPDALRTLSPWY